MAARRPKSGLVQDLLRAFRLSGNQDVAFDKLAAERLGVNPTDLHCLNIIENSGGLSAGQLATESGLTSGAVTGVIDRLERVGYASRVADPADRRRVRVEVTPAFYARADRIWGPLAADWQATLTNRFTAEELRQITDFLRVTNDLGRRHLDRLREMR
ncbi:MAG: MarR family transcriptional regulator [Solirubrobacterales bacterium]|nr:MarR family transcriptional regulator [Solirubrobacterales bacterium]